MPAGLWARSASIRTISCSCDKESGVAEAVAAAAAAAVVAEAEEDWERLELDTRFTAMARSNFGEYFASSGEMVSFNSVSDKRTCFTRLF